MLSAHYSGKINIADYWAVGDSRSVELSGYTRGTHSQNDQTLNLIIIGFNHDELETSINGIDKAAITVQTETALTAKIEMIGASSVMNVDWSTSDCRTALNAEYSSFYASLPSDIKNLIKSVNKITNIHDYHKSNSTANAYSGQTTTTDKIFLLSESETFGSNQSKNTPADYGYIYSPLTDDGMQYEYMKSGSNRIKCDGSWYLRTAQISFGETEYYYGADKTGSLVTTLSEYGAGRLRYYAVPAFCL